jgi:hypothetical protein
MEKKQTKKMSFPPVLKLLFRGYIIMAFILGMEWVGIITDIGLIIFLVSIVSISMVFGVGYLLVMKTRPVRTTGFDIPNTVLFFVKGLMVLFFVSLLAEFDILPDRITSILMLIIAGILVLAGVLSYLYEVLERSRPLSKRRPVSRPKTR